MYRFIAAAAVLLFAPLAPADDHGKGVAVYPPDQIDWLDGPPSLPKGAQMAVLEGDPTKEGPFVFRLKVPNGYKVMPHTHPKPERVTVISGTFFLGMGDKFDRDASNAIQKLPAGSYGQWEPGMKHFVWAQGETIIQFHGTGPWEIKYIDPKDDPRNKP